MWDRFGSKGKGTHMRLAHNSRVLHSREDWNRCYKEAGETADLEEEADIVNFGLQVPILEIRYVLDMTVKEGVEHLEDRFQVRDWVAYHAVLQAKSYWRTENIKPA